MNNRRVPEDHEWDRYGKCKWCPAERHPSYATLAARLAEALLRDIANREFVDEEECAASAKRYLRQMAADSADEVKS